MQTRMSPQNELTLAHQDSRITQFNNDGRSLKSDTRNSHSVQRHVQSLANASHRSTQLKTLQTKMQGKADIAQCLEEEEPLQGEFDTAQRVEEEEPLQGKFETAQRKEQAKPNNTGLPNQLKSGIESMSGMSMDHVKVHYNSDKPAQLNAHAYAQGSEIHVAPGQEKHLPHEAWHVVQQAQGRVKPTMQMKGDVQVNDDVELEHEADVMGERATAAGTLQLVDVLTRSPAGTHKPVLQGNFPDAYNDERRGSQGISKSTVQLDHMVPQATLKKFVGTYKVLDTLTSDGSSKWESTKAAIGEFRTALRKFPLQGHSFMSEGHLINLPNNIVPGLSDQVQGAGDSFDPQVTKASTAGNYDRYEETLISLKMREADELINKLNGLVDAGTLPATIADSKKSAKYDSDVDELLAKELKAIAAHFDALSAIEEPEYESDAWYEFGGDDKNVKKRPAEWIKDESQVAVGGTLAPVRADWQMPQFTFTTQALGTTSGHVTVVPVTVTVDADVPAATWAHLYDRHYLSTFGGTIEAVDTFWKTDPYTYLTGVAGTTLLQKELEIILKRSFNFSKPYNNLGDINEPSDNDVSWSEAAQKLFFQGTASPMLSVKDIEGVDYDVTIELKSIAPQDPDLAYALEPSQLEP